MEDNKTKIAISGNGSEKKLSKLLLFLKTIVHGGVLTLYTVCFIISIFIYRSVTEKQLEEPLVRMAKTYISCYFTAWNVGFQTTFLCLSLTHDALQWVDKDKSNIGRKIKYWRDVVFNGLVFPFTCFVHFMFWGLYFIDRELVFPKVYDEILPWWLNHCVHTNIMAVLIVETLLVSRRQPADFNLERLIVAFINVIYAIVYYSIFFFGHCWLYGVFGIMTWWQICIYQAGISLSSYIFYRMNFVINRLIHGTKSQEEFAKNVPNGNKNGLHDLRELGGDLRPNGNGLKNGSEAKVINEEKKELAEAIEENGVSVKENVESGIGENGDHVNGGYENGDDVKDWKLIGTNGESEFNGNGTFDKSWSNKYRKSRNEVENTTL